MRGVFTILVILAMLAMATWTEAFVIQDVEVLMQDKYLGGLTVNPGPEGVVIHPTQGFTSVYLLENPGFPIVPPSDSNLRTGDIIFFIFLTGSAPVVPGVTLQVTANVPDLAFAQSVDLFVPSDPSFWQGTALVEIADFAFGRECCYQPHAGTLTVEGPTDVPGPVTASYTLLFPVPEPSTLLLLGFGLAGLAGSASRRHFRS